MTIQLTQTPDLFKPVRLGRYRLKNRVVMAPLTRNRAGAGNVPQAMNAIYYRQRASAGLIITEGSPVSPQGVGYPGTPGIHNRQQIAGWRRVTDAVHDHGGRIFLQLWHVGRISHPSLQPDGALPVAPSAIRPEGDAFTAVGPQPFVTPRALDIREIPGIIGQFRTGAINALEAGFDGVEVHGANGYLLDQFLRDGANQRIDAYGGSVENRARLLLEVTEAVAGVWGADRVGVRLSPVNSFNSLTDSHPDGTFGHVARRLSPLGLAYLHVVEQDEEAIHQGFDRQRLRRSFAGPYIANGGYQFETANAVLAAKDADLVSFGALFIANPDLVERFQLNAPLNTPDPETFYGGFEAGYTDYPTLTNQPVMVEAAA
ncbi:MAG: alkene reductase [Alphaproteobacteria bacterium]